MKIQSTFLAAILVTTMWGCSRNEKVEKVEKGSAEVQSLKSRISELRSDLATIRLDYEKTTNTAAKKYLLINKWRHRNFYVVKVHGRHVRITFWQKGIYINPRDLEYICTTPGVQYRVSARYHTLHVLSISKFYKLIEDAEIKTKVMGVLDVALDMVFKQVMAEKTKIEKKIIESVSPIPTPTPMKKPAKVWGRRSTNRKWN